MYKKILLAIDGSEDSFRAAERIKEIGKRYSKVVIFNAIEEHFYEKLSTISLTAPVGATAPGAMVTPAELTAAKKAKAKKILKKAKELFKSSIMPVELRVIEDEDPDEYMLNIIEEEGFDLVAIGCTGEHSEFRKIFLGTIGSKLLYEAPCDVLIVR